MIVNYFWLLVELLRAAGEKVKRLSCSLYIFALEFDDFQVPKLTSLFLVRFLRKKGKLPEERGNNGACEVLRLRATTMNADQEILLSI